MTIDSGVYRELQIVFCIKRMKVLHTQAELLEARHLAIKSIFTLHPLCRVLPPDEEEMDKYFEYMIKESNRYKMAWGYYNGDKMVAFVFSFPAR